QSIILRVIATSGSLDRRGHAYVGRRRPEVCTTIRERDCSVGRVAAGERALADVGKRAPTLVRIRAHWLGFRGTFIRIVTDASGGRCHSGGRVSQAFPVQATSIPECLD